MNYTKQVKSFADHLVCSYAKYDANDQCYTLNIFDLADFDRHELASLMIASDSSLANEATSVDNPAYDRTMLPALIKHMSDTTNADLKNDFVQAWQEGVSYYVADLMQELIDECCADRLHGVKNEHGYYATRNTVTGDIQWRHL